MNRIIINLIFVCFTLPTFAQQNIPGNEVGGNGDRVSGWFAGLGRIIIEEIGFAYQRGEKIFGSDFTPVQPADLNKLFNTPIILVSEQKLELLTNARGEVKDLKVVFDNPKPGPNIFLRQTVWTGLYDKKLPDYRMALHAYLMALGYNDRDYLMVSRVPEEFFEGLPGYVKTQTAQQNLGLPNFIQLAESFHKVIFTPQDGGLVGIVFNENLGNGQRTSEYFMHNYPHEQNVNSFVLKMLPEKNGRPARVAWDYLPREGENTYSMNFNDIITTSDGGFLLIGCTGTSAGHIGKALCEYATLIKLNESGRRQWIARYKTHGLEAFRAFEKQDGNFLVATEHSVHLLTSRGNIVPTSTPFLMNGGTFLDAVRTSNDDFVFVGFKLDNKKQRPFAAQLSSPDQIKWQKVWTDRFGSFTSITTNKAGAVFAGGAFGTAASDRKGMQDAFPILTRLNDRGEMVWQKDMREMPSGVAPLNNRDRYASVVHNLMPWGESEVIATTLIATTSSFETFSIPFVCAFSFETNDFGRHEIPYGFPRLQEGHFELFRVDPNGKILGSAYPKPNYQDQSIVLSATPMKDKILVSLRYGTKMIDPPGNKRAWQ